MSTSPNIAFFGTPEPARQTLEVLASRGFSPSCIITRPDRPQGRGMELTPPPVKIWALEHAIPILQPEKIDEIRGELEEQTWDLFIVVAYGKILPDWLINLPKKGTLNVHYSLLPLYRGASPVESQILDGTPEVGVTIMEIVKELDAGGIYAEKKMPMPEPLPTTEELREKLTQIGADLLVETLPSILDGSLHAVAQDHSLATFAGKFSKEDAHIDLSQDPTENFRRIQALMHLKPYFFVHTPKGDVRLIITKAALEAGTLKILKVIPEGKKEVEYETFLKSIDS